jgi:hypothetical protein
MYLSSTASSRSSISSVSSVHSPNNDASSSNSSGIIIYTGLRFVGNVGKYKINVGQKNISKIFKKLERNDFENAKDMYDLKQSDISMLFYKINLKSGEKNIGRANFGPKYLQETFDDIDQIVKKYTWTKINE